MPRHLQLLRAVLPPDLARQRGNVDLDVLLLVQIELLLELRVPEIADPNVAELVVPRRAARRGRPQEHVLPDEVAVGRRGRARPRALALRGHHGTRARAQTQRVALDARALIRRRLRGRALGRGRVPEAPAHDARRHHLGALVEVEHVADGVGFLDDALDLRGARRRDVVGLDVQGSPGLAGEGKAVGAAVALVGEGAFAEGQGAFEVGFGGGAVALVEAGAEEGAVEGAFFGLFEDAGDYFFVVFEFPLELFVVVDQALLLVALFFEGFFQFFLLQ